MKRCVKSSHFPPLKMGTALSPQAKAVQHPVRSRFFEMISFSALCIRKPHGCEKARKREKNPRNREISGVRSHDIFFGFTICIVPPKKILLSNPADIGEHLPFFGFAVQHLPLYPQRKLSLRYIFLTCS